MLAPPVANAALMRTYLTRCGKFPEIHDPQVAAALKLVQSEPAFLPLKDF